MDRVNATTGDLPAAGIGDFLAWVRGGVGGGAALLTHGDVLISTLEKPAAIESGTRVLAGNLCVRGPVAGNGVPESYLTGELESLDPDQQEQVLRELDGEKVEVEGVYMVACGGRLLVRTQKCQYQPTRFRVDPYYWTNPANLHIICLAGTPLRRE